jgi:hypothetical protein
MTGDRGSPDEQPAAPPTPPGRRGWRPGRRGRRTIAAVALFAGLALAGFGGGHLLGAVATHGAGEHGQFQHHEHGDEDGGVVFQPAPGPISPPVPGR